MVNDIKTCQELNIVRPGDPTLQALSILSSIHGFVTMVIDNRVNALLGDSYPLQEVTDAMLASIFEGIGTTGHGE